MPVSPRLFAPDDSAGMKTAPAAQFERPERFQLRRARPLADYIQAAVPTDFEHNGEFHLHGTNLDSSKPCCEHKTSWIGVPGQAMRAAQLSCLASGVHGKSLASFWVLALVAYGVVWKPSAGFLLSWATLCFIGFLLSFVIDRISRRRSNSRRMWMTCASILPMLFQIISISRYHTRLASSFLYGHLLANILVGPALVCLSNGFSREIFHVPSAHQLRSMMSFGLIGILGILACVHLSTQSSQTKFSVVALVVTIGLFIWAVLFRTRTHVTLWHHEQPEVDYEAGRPWLDTYHDSHRDNLIFNTGSVTLFATGLAIPCSYAMISASEDPNSGSHMSGDLLSVILLPMLANTPVFLLGMQQAARGQVDAAFELNHAVGIELAYIMASIVLLKSVIFSMQVPFESTPADLVFLGVASMTSHRSFSGYCRATYLDGALCLGLYFMIALAVFLANDADEGS